MVYSSSITSKDQVKELGFFNDLICDFPVIAHGAKTLELTKTTYPKGIWKDQY